MIGRFVTVGEALAVFRAGDEGPLWCAPRVAVSTGGAEANVAMALARRGAPVSWFGRVGDDSLGRRIVRELRAEGVDVHATTDPDAPPPCWSRRRTPMAGRASSTTGAAARAAGWASPTSNRSR